MPCIIGEHTFSKALRDLGVSINLMSFSVAKKIEFEGDYTYSFITSNG